MNALALQDLAFLYIAEELEADERAHVEQRLAAGDADMQTAVDEAAQSFGMLPLALEPKQPRPELEDELMLRVRRSSESAGSAFDSNPAPASVAAPTSIESAGKVIPLRWVGGGLLGLAASLMLLFGAAFFASEFVSNLQQRGDERAGLLTAALRAEEDRVASLTLELDAMRSAEADSREQLRLSEVARQAVKSELEAARALRALEEDARETGPARVEVLAASERAEEVADLREEISRLEVALGAARAQATRSRAVLEDSSDREELAALGNALSDSRRALNLVRAADVGIVDLFAADPSGVASASVFWDAGLRDCYLHANGLERLQEGERYALWVEHEAGAVSRVSDFVGDERGDADFFAALPKGEGEITRTFVTRETRAGQEKPSGPVVIREVARAQGDDGRDGRRRYRRRSL